MLSAVLVLSGQFQGRARTLLAVCGGWFVWNLLVVSAATSKAPNFIFQSMLPVLFFCIYGPARWLAMRLRPLRLVREVPVWMSVWVPRLVTPACAVLALLGCAYLGRTLLHARRWTYEYRFLHEQFYQVAEAEQAKGANTSDLYILNSSPDDCWFRYDILFLTGSEARTLDEMLLYDVPSTTIQEKYRRVHFIMPVSDQPPALATEAATGQVGRYRVVSFDADRLIPAYRATLQAWVAASPGTRHYDGATACPWPPFLEKKRQP
jgi:hypothetical protein